MTDWTTIPCFRRECLQRWDSMSQHLNLLFTVSCLALTVSHFQSVHAFFSGGSNFCAIRVAITAVSQTMLTIIQQMDQTTACDQQIQPLFTRISAVNPNDPSSLNACAYFVAHAMTVKFMWPPPGAERKRFTNAKINSVDRKQTCSSVVTHAFVV